MQFMNRDFSAILRAGQEFISVSDNPQNVAAAQKLVYGLATFVKEEDMQFVTVLARHINFETAVAALAQLGEEEYKWAGQLLFEVANIDGHMNKAQEELWERFFEIYWEYKDAQEEE